MNEPLRILDDDANEAARAVLLAEPDELPPRGAEQRLLAKLGVAIAAAGVVGATEGAAAGASNGATGIVATASRSKWFWLSTIAGALAIGGMLAKAGSAHKSSMAASDRSNRTTAAPSTPLAEPPASELVEPPMAEQAASADPIAQPPPKPAVRRSSEAADTLDAEIHLLDQARAALALGHPARALERLDDYDRAFSQGHLGPEAFLIRLDALVRSGEGPTARRLARDYLAAHPTSPHASRIRRIVEGSGD